MATLREVLAREKTIVCPVAYDALSARVVEMSGCPIVWLGGMNVAASLGLPDMGLTTLTEVVERARTVVRAVNVPVICDVDTGFGGINNIRRTVMEFEAAGVSAIQFEDQVFPPRGMSIAEPTVIPAEEYVAKLRAAVDARKSRDFLIFGRTDCKRSLGMDEVIRRSNLYADNGADLASPTGPFTLEEHKQLVKEVKIPIKGHPSMDQLGVTPKQWEETGVKIVGYSYVPLFAALKAMAKSVRALSNGTLAAMKDELATAEDRRQLLRLDEWMRWENKSVQR